MNILLKIKQIVKEEYEAGATQEEIAQKYGVPQSHISNILNNKKGVSLELIDRILSGFELVQNQKTCNGNTIGTGARIQSDNNFCQNSETKKDAELFKSAAISAIINLDIPPESLAAVLKAINGIKI